MSSLGHVAHSPRPQPDAARTGRVGASQPRSLSPACRPTIAASRSARSRPRPRRRHVSPLQRRHQQRPTAAGNGTRRRSNGLARRIASGQMQRSAPLRLAPAASQLPHQASRSRHCRQRTPSGAGGLRVPSVVPGGRVPRGSPLSVLCWSRSVVTVPVRSLGRCLSRDRAREKNSSGHFCRCGLYVTTGA